MPIKAMPTFKSVPDKLLQIPQPGMGGLNLFDLEFEQEVNQSPDMLNMMYRNGTFGKRYGQSVYRYFDDIIYAMTTFNGNEIIHSGTHIYSGEDSIADNIPQKKGAFAVLGESLYYFVNKKVYSYKWDDEAYVWGEIEPYVPDMFINCAPAQDGRYEPMDELNLFSLQFNEVYNGTADTTRYYIHGDVIDIIDWETSPVVKVNDVETTAFTVATNHKYIDFTTAPGEGQSNVEITFTMKSSNLKLDRDRLLSCKYFSAYGANGSQRLFAGGGGASKIFYSDSYDGTYFPENNWILIGSTEDDVTAFGSQYNVLLVFKPREIYQVYSYQTTASMVKSDEEDKIGIEAFSTVIVNSRVGCDVPYSMQLVNNQLTWMNTREGICTLVSTNIADERNVRSISRNINHSNNMGVKGLLDYPDDPDSIVSADFDDKYFICLPTSGICFMRDYAISPFIVSSSKSTDPRELDWYMFDNFYVKQFVQIGKDLCYVYNKSTRRPPVYGSPSSLALNPVYYLIIKLDDSLTDFHPYNIEGTIPIKAHYMTPLFEYSAVEMLKTITNVYIQCRADRPTFIELSYITEESPSGEIDPEPIRVSGRIWNLFTWENFAYDLINFVNTFRRRCSTKKVQVLGVKVWNNEKSDLSISHMSFQYRTVKYIK